MAHREDRAIIAGMTLCGAHVAGSRCVDDRRSLWPRPEQRLDRGSPRPGTLAGTSQFGTATLHRCLVVHARPGVRRIDAQSVQHRQHRRGLPVSTQHSSEVRLAGNVHALVRQHRNNARRRHVGEARLVGLQILEPLHQVPRVPEDPTVFDAPGAPRDEKMFVDNAGDTVLIVDAATGEITQAQIFVAVLGASHYTFACATPRPTAAAAWIEAQCRRWSSSAAFQAHRARLTPCPGPAARPLRPELNHMPASRRAQLQWTQAKLIA